MLSSEISELRKSGKIEEALVLANQYLEEPTDDLYLKRAVSWVFYELVKKAVLEHSYEDLEKYMGKVAQVNLPDEEHMVFDNCAFKLGSFLFKEDRNNENQHLDQLFELIRNFHFTKPSEAYSFLLKAFLHHKDGWHRTRLFLDWWNLDRLRPEDYLKEEYNGNRTISLAEKAYISYAKKLLDEHTQMQAAGIPMEDSFSQQIEVFLKRLDRLIDRYPEMEYPPFYKAKLLMSLGDTENVLSALLPFARKRQRDFWIWDLMAEALPEDRNTRIACYCKALSLPASQEFLVRVRLNLAKELIAASMYSEAKTEIQQYIATVTEQGWPVKSIVLDWQQQAWYGESEGSQDNRPLYNKLLHQAEELLFRDIPEEQIAVEFVNHQKKILNFIRDKSTYGFFKYSRFRIRPSVGMILNVRFETKAVGGLNKVFTVREAINADDMPSIKEVQDNISINANGGFGFVEDVYLPPKLIKEHGITDGQNIKVKAIQSYNKTKDKLGWKAIELLGH